MIAYLEANNFLEAVKPFQEVFLRSRMEEIELERFNRERRWLLLGVPRESVKYVMTHFTGS